MRQISITSAKKDEESKQGANFSFSLEAMNGVANDNIFELDAFDEENKESMWWATVVF